MNGVSIAPDSAEVNGSPVLFSLAHFSDLHLGPLPEAAAWRNFALKRVDRLSVVAVHPPQDCTIPPWRRHCRRHRGRRTRSRGADRRHRQYLGLCRISPPPPAGSKPSAGPSRLTFVPGNHDAYVECPLGEWPRPFGAVDDRRHAGAGDTQSNSAIATPFPFVRLRKNVALIGLAFRPAASPCTGRLAGWGRNSCSPCRRCCATCASEATPASSSFTIRHCRASPIPARRWTTPTQLRGNP